MKIFDKENQSLVNQFDNINWIENTGISPEELKLSVDKLIKENYPKPILKAKIFGLILEKSRIAIDKDDIFQDKIFEGHKGDGTIVNLRYRWQSEVCKRFLSDEKNRVQEAYETGTYAANSDFGHTSPNSKLLLEIGFTGLLDRINAYYSKENLTNKQKTFYESCKITLESIISFINRLAKETKGINPENSKALYNIAKGKPSNIYEAMQLLIVYYFLHENIIGTRVRTLGRLDVMLYPFYKNDIASGRYSKAEIKEMIKFFFNKFWCAKIPFDLPICLGGIDEDGNEVTNELSYLLVETYNELNIHSPKIHIRVSDRTPEDFIKLVLKCIRGGNSSFVFLSDNAVVKSLVSVGIKEKDAMNYIPIGCYEPAVWGKEIGCTGNGGINLAKAVEFAVTNGVDLKSGKQISVKTGKIKTYEDFIAAVKKHIKFMAESGMEYIKKIERYYGEINPDPLLSCMYDRSVKTGIDVYEGGAEYNNTSYCFYFIASLVDSVCAVKRLVFKDKIVDFEQLCSILKSNWENNEKLRLLAKSIPEKYGNNNTEADAVTKDFTAYCSSLVNNKPNSRGGVFKASLYTIDHFVYYGEHTMATPDGRRAGEVLSKNLCATVGMDKNGVTALINSVTQINHSDFPNGSVLDIVLHPSAVMGEEGLCAMYGILKTYIKKGGMALHGNIFNPEDLKKAQEEPEKYKNLQVRVCGWNAYFINLSKAEQDCFIKQAYNSAV
ncbi:MAG: hypothetical protein K5768_06940 [Firmicutes bacterium]|nr:hypothetical protein [Bacillota bacterium]